MKFVSLQRAFKSHTYDHIKVYGELSSSFKTLRGVRQGHSISPFLFTFINGELIAGFCRFSGYWSPNGKRREAVWPRLHSLRRVFESADYAQRTLDKLEYFSTLMCEMLLQHWTTVVQNLILDDEEPTVVDRFDNLVANKDGSTTVEATKRISKPGAVYTGLKHFWLRPDISLKLKVRLHCREVSDHRCLCSITRFG